jgi:polyribonucleotide nucleotidyltransferase
MYKKISAEIGGKVITFETGKLAKQTDGSVVVSCGDSIVLVTVVAEKVEKNMGFMPLTIEYQERMYAAGRIPGSYFRREIGRPSEKEVLTCRLIDRPLRPLFPDGYMSETQVIATVFSADPEFDPDVLAMNGASFALTLSDIPWAGPVAAARVGYINGEYILNPTHSELAQSALDIVVAGTGAAVVMVEGQAGELGEDVILDAIFFGHRGMQPLIALQCRGTGGRRH